MPPPTDRPPKSAHASPAARVIVFVLVAGVVGAGIWITGALITSDATASMALTALWMALAGAAALLLARRHRPLRVPAVAGYLVIALAAAVYLGPSALLDRDADEAVVVAAEPAPDGEDRGGAEAPPGNQLVARGRFSGVAHPGRGVATAIRRAEGDRVLTLTGFEVDNGPDLRVYLVRGEVGESSVEDFEDLGALKGNTGDQQYRIPRGVDLGENVSVVIWCRAFTVAFARAPLKRG